MSYNYKEQEECEKDSDIKRLKDDLQDMQDEHDDTREVSTRLADEMEEALS